MSKIIHPRILKGFRDFLPEVEISRRALIRSLEDHFISFGFLPIDTPVLEYAEILLSKGGGETDKQTYRFTDHGGRDVALRFDLTVPFARFIATHHNTLTMPFKRYHIGKAWRGENTQRGRYREFIQCDFDIVGTDSCSADLEVMLIMHSAMEKLGAGKSHIRFNHRGLFNRLLAKLGIENHTAAVLRSVDKIGKMGWNAIQQILEKLVGADSTAILLDFITPAGDNRSTLKKMEDLADAQDMSSVHRVLSILNAGDALGLQNTLLLDPSITRGLDYYTGLVFETFLDDLPELGSICSGGRYDDLTGLFMKNPISGVGASIGLDRLMAGLQELGQINMHSSSTNVLILMLDENLLASYHSMAQYLRSSGIIAEVYPEAKKLSAQFKYAAARSIPLALIAGPNEMATGTVNLKDTRSRESFIDLTLETACEKVCSILGIATFRSIP